MAQLAASMNISRALLEGDSNIVTAALRQEESDVEWSILNTISNSISALSSIPSWIARKISRVENLKAAFFSAMDCEKSL